MEEDFPRKREMHKKEKSEKVENVTKKKIETSWRKLELFIYSKVCNEKLFIKKIGKIIYLIP